MALSNWDTYALTLEGKPCDGGFTSPAGLTVEFYKNWLYVRHDDAWQEGFGFAKPTFMQISEGEIRIGDVNVLAVRGPKRGIYAAVWAGYEYDKSTHGVVGIGCYAFDSSGEAVGVEKAEVTWLARFLRERAGEYEIPQLLGEIDFAQGLRFNQGDGYLEERGVVGPGATKVGEAEEPLLLQMFKDSKGVGGK